MSRFDEVISKALGVARLGLGEDAVRDATIVRDVGARVTIILANEIHGEQRQAVANTLHEELGPYSPGLSSVLLTPAELIDPDDIFGSPDRVRLEDEAAFLVDRLLTNQEWLRKPIVDRHSIRTATGFSIKGGVGRSTALAVWAWHLARLGRRVVVVDLDLEAPGIGFLLLDTLPPLGLVDWLAEDLVGRAAELQLDDLLAGSPIADSTAGRVDVIPAFGDTTKEYVTKLGRVSLAGVSKTGEAQTLAHRLVRLFKVLEATNEPPDLILLDARAGLHDLAAAAVTQLGAEVFLFGRDEEPSWQAYRLLFEHIRRSGAIEFGMPDHDLRLKLKMVGAQAGVTEGHQARLVEHSYQLWASLYDQRESSDLGIAPGDPEAPHYPLAIYFEDKLRGLRLTKPEQRPAWPLIENTFGTFLKGATERIGFV